MNKGIISRVTFLGAVILVLCSTLLSPQANAVTYGSTVADPTISAPWAVSIWNSPDNDEAHAEFTCSGTLISPHTVLTAAHCTLYPGAYFVKIKSQALNDETPLTPVSGVWYGNTYDPKTFSGDIGLLKLDEDFTGITYPSLANLQFAKSINAKTLFKVYGWGKDQLRKDADLLRTAKLNLQDSQAAKDYKKLFNPKSMISAGRKIAAQNVWSGACDGDSGGPLIAEINGINVIAGVVGWGEKSCLSSSPTVFSRVSYYYSDIQNGLKSVELQSSVVNRTAPVATTNPQITGNIATNGSITCDPGQWKNSVSTSITWTLPKRLIGTTSSSIRVLTSDAGQIFSCTVIISTKSGTIVRKVLTKQSANAPILTAQPAISGVDLSAPVTAGSTLRCDNWNWDGPVDSEELVQWFLTSQANPPAPINGQLVGKGRTLALDANLISQLKGRYVTCDVTGVRNGFSVDGITSIKLNPLDGPTISSVNVSGSSLSLGSSLTCLFSASQSATKIDIAWGTSPDGINFSAFPGITGNVLQINKSVIQQGAGKVVGCQVKVTNTAGQAQRVGVANSPFPIPPSAPIVSISNSGTVSANSYLSCSSQASSGNPGPLTYQWGITSTANSNNFIGGALSSSYSLSMNSSSFAQAGGNYLTCVVTATNDAGSTSGASSVYVTPQIMPLPTLSRPYVVGETPQTNTLTDSIGIPPASGFDATKMSLVLSLNPSGGSCASPIQISSTPTTINCSGLQPSTNYSAQLTVSYLTGGNGATQVSPILSFTTAAIQSSLYVCSTTCTGSLTNTQLNAELSDQRSIEAKSLTSVTVNGSQTGAPITHSTCVGLGCNPGTAPSLPVSCGSAGIDTTEVISNVSAQITTAFRYCKASSLDIIAPTVTNNSLSTTGYAPIIPTIGVPATSIQIRFGASDSVGITTTSVRLINPGNVTVSIVSGTFLVGSLKSGTYQAYLATALSGPINGDVYQIQAQASDAAGNTSGWVTIGTFTVTSNTALTPTFSTPTQTSTGFTFQISNFDANYGFSSTTTSGSASISATGFVTVSGLTSGASSTVTISTTRSGYANGSGTITSSASGVKSEIVLKTLQTSLYGSQNRILTSFRATSVLPITGLGIQFKNSLNQSVGGGSIVNYRISGSAIDGIYQDNSIMSGNLWFPEGRLSETISVYGNATDSSGFGTGEVFLGTFIATSDGLLDGLSPTFASPSNVTSTGFSVQILNYDPRFTWSVVSTSGSATINSSGLITVSGLGASEATVIAVTTKQTGYKNASRNTAGTSAANQVALDTQPPSILAGSGTLSSPSITGQVVSIRSIGNVSDGMSTNSDYTVAINISDNVGVSSVNFYVDSSGEPALLGTQIASTLGSGSLISGTAQNGTWSYSSHFPSAGTLLATLSMGCGRYTVRVNATDAAGNSTGTIAAREIDIVTCTQ